MRKKEDPVPRTQLGGQLILGTNEQKGGPFTQDTVIGGQLILGQTEQKGRPCTQDIVRWPVDFRKE